MEECPLALVCNKKVRLASLCIYGVMLIYLSTIIYFTLFKYKVYGFTLKLLVGLEIAVTALLIAVVLTFKYEDILDRSFLPSPTNNSVQKLVHNVEYGFLALHFVSTTLAIGIFWVFALKYWSVALKFELVVNEEEITSKSRLVDAMMLGGLIILTVA
jgi:hypothetical protein